MGTSRSTVDTVWQFVLRWGTICMALLTGGCANTRQTPLVSQRIQDPPYLSPYARPLTSPGPAPSPYGTLRPVAPVPPQAAPSQAPPTVIPPRSPNSPGHGQPDSVSNPPLQFPEKDLLSAPPPSSLGKPESSDSAPSIVRGDPIKVTVVAPESARVGEAIPFAITLQSSQPQPMENVTVLCTLPDGIVYPGKSERAFRQRLGRLTSGEERKLDLPLQAERAGKHCVEFRISAEGMDEIVKSGCVNCRDESVKLEVIGPTEKLAGNRAEFVVTLANLTGRELPDVRVTVEHDGSLEPREASAGALRSPGQLEWDLGLVRIDERVQIQVEFTCGTASDQTCVSARVKGRDLDTREFQTCLRIAPLSDIEVDVDDADDPVVLGEKVQYRVRIANHRLEPISDLRLEIDPQGVQPVAVHVDGVDVLSSASFDVTTGLLSVPLPGPLPPEGSTLVTLQTTATHSGAGGLRATVTQQETALEVSACESTVVNAVPGSIASGRP